MAEFVKALCGTRLGCVKMPSAFRKGSVERNGASAMTKFYGRCT